MKLNVFNWKIYLKYNQDLNQFNINTKEQATHHFNTIGKNENRKHCLDDILPSDFDWKIYKEINIDLRTLTTEKDVILHYITCGINENRSYKYVTNGPIKCKHTFRLECTKQLHLLKNIELNPNKKNQPSELVFIEFRWYEHIELLLRNAILKFPNWSHTVFCGKINGKIMEECCNFISPKINVIVLDKDNITPSEYSQLLVSKYFWEKISGENIIIHQEDSYIFHNRIEPFLNYDYVGAPWPLGQNDNALGVGNGGFSFRKKSKMLEVISKVNVSELKINSHTLKYIKNTNSTFLPEDIYFSKALIDYKLGNVPNRQIASEFSQETQPSKNPLGGHNFFLAKNKIDIDRYKGLKLVQEYYKLVDHRGGWKHVINYGIEKNIISYARPYDVLLIDCCEKYFLWDNMPPVKTSWVGIIHTTPKTPSFLKDTLSLKSILLNINFRQSLSTCVAIITLSDYQKSYIIELLDKRELRIPPILSIKHPINALTKEFDIDIFEKQSQYNIVLLGQQLRKITDLTKIEKTPIVKNKIWLSGIRNEKIRTDIVKREITGLSMPNKMISDFFATVILPYLETFSEYDTLIQESIIVLPLFDAAANNSVLECIISNTPLFVQRNRGTIEYLGAEYPLFFDDIVEINTIINNKDILINKYKTANDYLKKIDKTKLSYKHFYSEILKFINNIE